MHIISIVGPTAVGKSALALELAEMMLADGKVFGVDLISADSRQVYKGLKILTGADKQPANPNICLHGVALIKPTEEWSLAHFHQLAHQVIENAVAHRRAVIMVGGTGLYQTQLLQPTLVDQAPPVPAVREKAEKMNVIQLQAWLEELDAGALVSLNVSDRANPRRLVRAIERALWRQQNPSVETLPSVHMQQFIGLQTTNEDLAQRIRQRVLRRIEMGVENEVRTLEVEFEEMGVPFSKLPAHTACGLREVLALIHGEIDRDQCLELWTKRELSYAKRQDTWWKKHPEVQWFPANTSAESLL